MGNPFRRAGSVYSPTIISSLQHWYDASDSATITQSSGLVSQWNDKKGSRNYTTSGATRPTYNATGLNSKPTLVFGGTHRMTGTVNALSDMTVMAVVQPDSLAGAYSTILCIGTYAPLLFIRGSSLNYCGVQYTTPITYATDQGLTVGTAVVASFDVLLSTKALGFFKNSTASSTNYQTNSSAAAVTAGTAAVLGSDDPGTSTDTLNGRLSELLIFSARLTSTERTDLVT